MEKVTGSKVKVSQRRQQKSRELHGSPEPIKGHEPKLTQLFQSDYMFKVVSSKVNVTETVSGGGVPVDDLCQLLSSFYYKKCTEQSETITTMHCTQTVCSFDISLLH